MSKDRGANILAAIQQMAMDNNQGLRMTTTLVNVTEDQRGSIVGFGTEKEMSDDAKFQIRTGMPGEYLACAFFIKRSELKKYLEHESNKMVRHRTPPICISARTGSRRHRGFTQLDPTKKRNH